MNLIGKKLAILGGTRITCEIVKAAKTLGVHTTVIDYNPPEESPAKLIADEYAQISVADVNVVAAYINEHDIDGVTMGYSDTILPMYADICEAAGLPCYGTRKQFETFTDKDTWKKLCAEYGVPTAREYDAAVLDLEESQIDFPLFVKPSDGSGARGASVARNKEELQASYEFAKRFSKNGKVLIEKYLEGPETTVFWLFIDGCYEVFMLGNRLVKHNQANTIPLPCGYTFPAAVLPKYLEEVAPKVREMLKSQGVQNGMMFMQCITQDGLPYVYDIGYRLTGSLEHYIVKETAGYSPMDMLICHAFTGKMTDDEDIWKKVEHGLYAPCYNVSCLMKPGTIDHFEGLEKLVVDPSVITYVKAHVEGETLPPEAKGELRQIALRILGAVDSPSEFEPVMVGIQEEVMIVSPEGLNLRLPGLSAEDFRDNVLEVNMDE